MKIKKRVLLFVGALLLIVCGVYTQSEARVDIIGINIPAYRFTAPPSVVVIPGTYVYLVPDANVDVLFYQGYWYRPHEGRWFRARAYNGPWVYLAAEMVPHVLLELPTDYRHIPPGYHRIEYRVFNRNWKRWERDKYWDKDKWWSEGRPKEHHEEKVEKRREDKHEDRREERHDDRRDRY